MNIDWTQISIGMACVATLGYVLVSIIPAFFKNQQAEDTELAQVVENNTRVMEQLNNILQVSFTRQETKLDELVDYVRRCKQ